MQASASAEVLVIGGGQAGLATGYFLTQQGLDFLIVDRASAPAAAWRDRWSSLSLFTAARYDSLPGLPFPGPPDHYPGKDEVADYLTDYADHFELPVELNSRVRTLRESQGTYFAELDDRTYEADQVVVATGAFQIPSVPPISELLDPTVAQIHSGAYRTPETIPKGPVLVVGGGNTGYQIAQELAASHEVHLSIGSRQTPLPKRILGRDLFWYLEATGLMRKTVASRIGRRMASRDTLIGSSPRALGRRHGVSLHDRAVDAVGSTVRFEDETKLDLGTVIWATGFENDHSWIHVPVFDETGRVVQRRGVTDSPGLYFVGLSWQHTRGSALLGWVKDDAEYISQQIEKSFGRVSQLGPTEGRPVMSSPIRIEESVQIERSPAEVWDAIADYSLDLQWRRGLVEMTPDPPGAAAMGTKVHEVVKSSGRTYVADTVVTEFDAGRSYRFKGEGTIGGLAGARSVRPATERSGAKFTYEIVLQPKGAMRLMRPLLGYIVRSGLRKDLEALKSLLEARG